MKRILFSVLAVLAVLSCSSDTTSVVNISAPDFSDSTQVVVYRLDVNQLKIVDTVFIKGGKAKCEITSVHTTPDFYYVDAPGKGRVSLVLSSGDKVDVNLAEFSVSGSDESVLFNEIEAEYAAFSKSFAEKVNALAKIEDPSARKTASEDISRSFINYKRQSVKRVMTSPASMTNIPVLFRKVSDLPVFSEVNDVYLMQTVYDTLSVLYPESPYVVSLKNEIDSRKNRNELANMLASAQTVSFPDITLPDVSGTQRSLSEIENKVVLLLFWNSKMENISVMNAELKGLYSKYKDFGFEIYQVAFDTDKAAWAASVKSQQIEWVSVVDTRGSQSTYIPIYYVTDIPFAYVMDRNGNILEKGVVDISKLDKVIATAVRK